MHNMLSGGGSLVFGNENPVPAYISRRTEASLPGHSLPREVINRNSTDLHRNGSNAERFGICGSFISCNRKNRNYYPSGPAIFLELLFCSCPVL